MCSEKATFASSFTKAPKLQVWGEGVFIREEEYLMKVLIQYSPLFKWAFYLEKFWVIKNFVWIMCMWTPLHKPPLLILESQIPPTMKTYFKKFVASYTFAFILLGLLIVLCLLFIVDSLTPLEFVPSFTGLLCCYGLVVAYVKDM